MHEHAIVIYRNAGSQIPIQVDTSTWQPNAITGYNFALIIFECISAYERKEIERQARVSNVPPIFELPILTCDNPGVVEPGLLTFTFSYYQTQTLQLNKPYKFSVMSIGPGQINPTVNLKGKVIVRDAPLMQVGNVIEP